MAMSGVFLPSTGLLQSSLQPNYRSSVALQVLVPFTALLLLLPS